MTRKAQATTTNKVVTGIISGALCWPLEALYAMLGLRLLHHERFHVPTPGYVSSFLVVVGGELLIGAVTLTREVRKAREAREAKLA